MLDKLLKPSANKYIYIYPGIPTAIKTMGVNITTIVYLRVLIIEIGSTIILMVVETHGVYIYTYVMIIYILYIAAICYNIYIYITELD